MLEMLLGVGGGNQRTYYPESGPGNKELLAGTLQAGYFGEISASELFQGSEVDVASGLTTGTLSSPLVTWLKFAYKGKFLFVAMKQIRTNLAWMDLYNAGLVYGERGGGKYIPASGAVDQFKYLYKDDGDGRWFFKNRLIRGMSQDPGTIDQHAGSEWDDLLYRVITGEAVLGRWASISPSLFSYNGSAMQSWVMETDTANLNNTFYRGSSVIGANVSRLKTDTVTNIGWRPVLELFDSSNMALNPENMTGAVDIPLAPDLRLTGILDGIAYNPATVYKVPDTLVGVEFSSKETVEVAARPTSVDYTISTLKLPGISRETFSRAVEPSNVGYSVSQLKAVPIVLTTF